MSTNKTHDLLVGSNVGLLQVVPVVSARRGAEVVELAHSGDRLGAVK